VINLDFDDFIASLLEGDVEKSISIVKQLRDSGISENDIVVNGIEKAMESLDTKCTIEEYNLLEIMLVGRAVMSVIRYLFPEGEIPSKDLSHQKTVIVASLEGDVHDLGKNIVKSILTCRGFHVFDCGKDCPVLKIVEAAKMVNPIAICVSGLISPIILQVRKIKSSLALENLGYIPVLAGGAALKMLSAESLQVDYVGETVFDAERKIDELIGKEENLCPE
jgi:dimethylamine corrinoid protein